MSRMFWGPIEGPLTIAWEEPMLATSLTTKYEKPLTTSATAAARQLSAYVSVPALERRDILGPAMLISALARPTRHLRRDYPRSYLMRRLPSVIK
jgi:hypothetical protein